MSSTPLAHHRRSPVARHRCAAWLLAAAAGTLASPAFGQIVDTQVPLSYNFNGMAHTVESVPLNDNTNADQPDGYRSIADRGLYVDPADPTAFGSSGLVGATGLTYSIVTQPFVVDVVHLGNRALLFPFEAAVNIATNIGVFPNWALTAAANNHTTPQVSTLASPVTLDAGSSIGVLYHASNGGGQFDCVLNFSDGSSVTARLAAPDWFGNAADPAVVAGAGGLPVLQQRKLARTPGSTFTTFRGLTNNDGATLAAYSATNAGPNLNVIEGIISVPKMTANGINVVGKSLVSITFGNATYPANTGRGYAIFATTVRTGQPLNANCGTPAPVIAGNNAVSNVQAFGAAPSACGTNDTSAVWFSYTATTTGAVEVRTCGATFDTTLAVYNACATTPVACNDNGCGLASRLQFSAVAGNTYLIRLAGNNGATGNVTLRIDDPAPVDITMPLQFNWNGINHGAPEQTTTTPPNENRSNINGYRSIADRGLLANGTAGTINFGGTVGSQGMLYQIYDTPLQSDMVALGDRTRVANGARVFSPPGTTTFTNDNGVPPAWLNTTDLTGPQTSSMSALNAVMGPNTKIGLLYHSSDVAATRLASFDVTLAFTDNSSVTVTVQSNDWFWNNTGVLPAPAVAQGLEDQRSLGTYRAVQNTDRGTDTGTAPSGGWLKVNEAIISTASLIASGRPDISGKTLASITFSNPIAGSGTVGNNFSSAFGIYAATLRNPASFSLNFGPSAVGTLTPNQLVVGNRGKLTVNVSRGSGSPNNLTSVAVDASSIGLGTLALNDSGLNGDVRANDNVWSRDIAFPVSATPGGITLPFVATDAQNRTATGNIIFTLTAPVGAVTPNPITAGDNGLVSLTLTPNAQLPTPIGSVVLDLSSVGGGTVNLNDGGTTGDPTANDGVWNANFTLPAGTPAGETILPLTITDTLGQSATGQVTFTTLAPRALAGTGAATPNAVFGGGQTLLTVNVTTATGPVSTGVGVTVDLLALGLSASTVLLDDGTNGDVTAGDGIYSALITVPTGATPGAQALPFTISDAQARFAAGTINLRVRGADEWDETASGGADAGELLADAQRVTGTGGVSAITGQMAGGSDADAFVIRVDDPALFSATTVGGATFDTQLFLFNLCTGLGVASNDDNPGGGTTSSLTSALLTQPGYYVLAISGYNRDPVDASAGLIWANAPFNTERSPDGPGAANPLAAWTGTGAATAPYTIFLTGASRVPAGDLCAGTGGCNLADVTGIGGPPSTPDGILTGDDFNAFIGAFAAGDLLADITGIGGPPSAPDGIITGDDFNAFIAAFAAGCP
ncbi:MAG: hypothetical protein LW650_11890 [Planctomycetaceae bacterium]|jgi:hypothetical protein|nr:hypothetical protein [Phycisphaerales bacterium]MCE2654129.1 hypothetical protein [Planctomycetaceae bacterium]